MTREEEDLAIALHACAMHGTDAPVWIATQIGRLALSGDLDGVERWKAVAAAYQTLEGRSVRAVMRRQKSAFEF